MDTKYVILNVLSTAVIQMQLPPEMCSFKILIQFDNGFVLPS